MVIYYKLKIYMIFIINQGNIANQDSIQINDEQKISKIKNTIIINESENNNSEIFLEKIEKIQALIKKESSNKRICK